MFRMIEPDGELQRTFGDPVICLRAGQSEFEGHVDPGKSFKIRDRNAPRQGEPDRPVVRFQNGGVVCLVRERHTDVWVVRWAIVPHP